MAQFGPLPIEPEIRFWKKVAVREGGCWEWTAAKRRGYGVFAVTARDLRIASRYAWEITHGPIPASQQVLHGCDNPGCVRPSHLFLGSQSENLADAYAKGRLRPPNTPPPMRADDWLRWFGKDESE